MPGMGLYHDTAQLSVTLTPEEATELWETSGESLLSKTSWDKKSKGRDSVAETGVINSLKIQEEEHWKVGHS